MALVSVTAVGSEATTGSAIGRSYAIDTALDLTNRETNKITSVESSFLFTPVTLASVLIVHCIQAVDPATADSAHKVLWGYSTGVYQHELYIGESSAIRLADEGPVAQLYLQSTGATEFWVECQVWSQ